jgi:small-conductance mechanosensitive channel
MKYLRGLMALIIVAMFFVPTMVPASDAVSPTDVSVSVLGYDVNPTTETVGLEVESGKSKEITLYVVNKSASRLSVYIVTAESDDEHVKIEQTGSSAPVLKPAGDSDSGDVMTITAKISADTRINTGARPVHVDLHLQDLDGSNYAVVTLNFSVDVTSAYDSTSYYNKFLGIFPNTLDGFMGSSWFAALVSFVIMQILMWGACLLALPVALRIMKVNKAGEDIHKLKRSVMWMSMIIVFVFSLSRSLMILGMDADAYYYMNAISNVVYVCAGAILAWNIYLFIIQRVVGNVEKSLSSEDSSLIPLFKMIGRLIISVVAVTLILASFGVDLAGLLVSAGVVSLGITLGAQNVLNQFFSGIVILSTRPFKKGDFLKINGEVYIVRKVKLMYTEFNNWGKDQIVTMPNNAVASATLINLTRGDKLARITVFASVAYDTDLEKAKSLMIQAATSHPHVILDGTVSKPSVTLTDWLDSGIQLRLACYVDDFDSNASYSGQLRETITQLFRENDIEIPYSRVQIDILSNCDSNPGA